jgi:hypothetical protein
MADREVLASGLVPKDLTQNYSVKFFKNTVRIRAPNKTVVSVSRDCDHALLALSAFAPTGLPTIQSNSKLALVDVATGRSIEFPAGQMCELASLVAAFAVIPEAGTEELTASPPRTLPDAIFEPPTPFLTMVPDWIASNPDFKPTLVEDDGRIVLTFAPLRASAKSKYLVEGRCEVGVPDYWGYEVSADGKPFGWVVLHSPGTVVVTGAGNAKYSKHRNVTSAMFRLSSHLDGMVTLDASE